MSKSLNIYELLNHKQDKCYCIVSLKRRLSQNHYDGDLESNNKCLKLIRESIAFEEKYLPQKRLSNMITITST